MRDGADLGIMTHDVPHPLSADTEATGKKGYAKRMILAEVGISLCAAIALAPPFPGLNQSAMACLSVIFGTIYFVSTKLLNDFLAGALGFIMLVLLHVTDMATAFSGLADPTVILLFGAFGMGGILVRTKAFERLSKPILSRFAHTFKGRVSALMLIGMLITPLIPSNAAKGIIMSGLSTTAAKDRGYKKGSQAATGLFMAGWVPVGVIGVCFLSGNVYGVMLAGLVAPEFAAQFTWIQWVVNSFVFLVVMVTGTFFATKLLYRPRAQDIDETIVRTGKETPGDEPASEPLTLTQKLSLGVIGACLVLWIFSSSLNLDDAWIALVGFVAMVLLGCEDRKKVLSTCIPWNILIFVAFTLSLSTAMTETGLEAWLTDMLGAFLIPLMGNIWLFIPATCIAIYAIRFIIISQPLAMLAVFLFLMPVGIAAGIHPWVIGFICASSVFTWNMLPQSIQFLAALGATGDYIGFNRCVKMSVFLMGWTIVALWASVGFWMALGLL